MPVFWGQYLSITANTTNARPSTRNVNETRDSNPSNKPLLALLFSTITGTNSDGSGAGARDRNRESTHNKTMLGEQIRRANKANSRWMPTSPIRVVVGKSKEICSILNCRADGVDFGQLSIGTLYSPFQTSIVLSLSRVILDLEHTKVYRYKYEFMDLLREK